MLEQTPSQTIGPFFDFCLTPKSDDATGINRVDLVNEHTQGDRISIAGQVFDGNGEPVSDAMIEIWQVDANGRYHHPEDDRKVPAPDPNFYGFGRCATDKGGAYQFSTIKPGRVPGIGGVLQAPHINMIVFGRGLLAHAFTRIYLAGEEQANATDSVLNSVAVSRRGTLITSRQASTDFFLHRFDIHLQGDRETVFFDV